METTHGSKCSTTYIKEQLDTLAPGFHHADYVTSYPKNAMYMYVSECNYIFLAAFAMREAVFCPHGYVCTHMKFGKSDLDTLRSSKFSSR